MTKFSAKVDLPTPAAPDEEGVGAAFEPAPQQLVDVGVAAGRQVAGEDLVMLGGDEPGMYRQTPPFDGEVVEAAAELDAAHLDDAKATALGAIIHGELLQQHDAVRDRMELEIVLVSRQIVEQNDRAVSAGERNASNPALAVGNEANFGPTAAVRTGCPE